MKKIRFVYKNTIDQNLGFDENEIKHLINHVKETLPKFYLEFLKNAGRKSNALEIEFNSIESLLEFQHEFKSEISESQFIEESKSLWCFYKANSSEYYFFYLNQEQNPIVYCFSKTNVSIDNGWNSKYGPIDKKTNFVEFINWKTNGKFGLSFGEKLKKYTYLIIAMPILIPSLIYLKIKAIR